MYSLLTSKLVLEIEERLRDSDKLEPWVSFISNPVMQTDMMCVSEQLSEAFNLNVGEVEMESHAAK